jgi:hypothetical protein
MIKLGAIIGVCILGVTALFFYSTGMFDTLELTREPRGPYHLIYREYRGPYKGVPYVMNTVYRYVRDTLNVATHTGFAVFYDNPQSTAAEKQRSISGVVVTDTVTVAAPCKSGVFERTDAVVGTVKLRSFFSYTTGGYRFYTRLQQFTEEKKIEQTGPVLELYDMSKRTILFVAPVGRTIAPVPEFGGPVQ